MLEIFATNKARVLGMEASCCYVEVEFPDGDAEAADAKVTQAQHSSWNSKYHIYYYVLVVET
jgi:ATP/maltotriose-dependent transcriptional regulator MalT